MYGPYKDRHLELKLGTQERRETDQTKPLNQMGAIDWHVMVILVVHQSLCTIFKVLLLRIPCARHDANKLSDRIVSERTERFTSYTLRALL